MQLTRCLLLASIACIGAAINEPCRADDSEEGAARALIKQGEETAAKGLTYLKGQQRVDGSFGTAGASKSVAVASLSGLAFLMSGEKGPSDDYREAFKKCLAYVEEHIGADGLVNEPEGAITRTMYNQACATSFLAAAYRHDKQDKTLEKLKASVGIILNAQNDEGAWRYLPKKSDGDGSVTACVAVALHSAKEAGAEVPQKSLDKAMEYLTKLQNEDGGFRYVSASPGSAFPRSGAATAAIHAAGGKTTGGAEKARKYLQQFRPAEGASLPQFFLHGHYYAVQVMCGKDAAGNLVGQEWYSALVRELSRQQRKDGGWDDAVLGPEYSSATACVILLWPKRAP